jgi:hypothetical protein
MKDSLGQEPRWNADRCAPPPLSSPARGGGGIERGARPHPQGAAELDLASVGVSPPIFFFVLSFFFFVMPGLDPGIHADAALTKCFHRLFARYASAWTAGSSPTVTTSESAVTMAFHSSGAQTRRENEKTRARMF